MRKRKVLLGLALLATACTVGWVWRTNHPPFQFVSNATSSYDEPDFAQGAAKLWLYEFNEPWPALEMRIQKELAKIGTKRDTSRSQVRKTQVVDRAWEVGEWRVYAVKDRTYRRPLGTPVVLEMFGRPAPGTHTVGIYRYRGEDPFHKLAGAFFPRAKA